MRRMSIVLMVIAGIALGTGSCATIKELKMTAEGKAFYVATDGRDDHPGTKERPFATLQRARDEVRKQKQAGTLKEGISVIVRRGTYCLPETLQLGPEDSGTTYQAYEGEKAVLMGAKQVTGFVVHKGQVLKADVGAQGLKGKYFRQLFFDGKRMHLARYPNYDPKNPYGGGWAFADGTPSSMYQDIPEEDKRTLHYKKEDARQWSKPEEGEVFVFPRYNWWNNIVRIASTDPDKRTLTLAGDASYSIRPGDRYYVRNIFEELDSPGEWFLDAPDVGGTETWTLYFWPPTSGAPPTALEGKAVYAPIMRTIIEIGPGSANITIRGFVIEGCEGTAITLNGANDCLIAGNTIRNVGDYNGSGAGVDGGNRNGVVGNDIYEVGRNGISLSGGDRPTLTPAGNYAENNYIHHVGVFYKQGVGISMTGCGLRASHNLVHDGPRMGIMFSGNNLLIEYNEIRHVNLETEDTGAVYTGGRDWIGSRGTVIRYNYFHDILGFGKKDGKWISPYFAWGVYLDDNAGGVDVIGNIVVRATRAGLHLHNGRDNLIENNVFADNGPQQAEYSGWTDTHRYWTTHLESMIKGYESVVNQPAWKNMRNMHTHPTKAVLPDRTIMSGNVLQRNIFYYRDPKAKLFSFRTVSFEHNKSDYNLVYNFGHPIQTGQFKVKQVLGPNLVANPSYEEGEAGELPKDWRWQIRPGGNATAGVDPNVRCDGKQSLRLDWATATDDKGRTTHPEVVSSDMPAKLGQAYRITGRIKAEKPGTRVSFGVQSYVANVYFWSKQTQAMLATEWKECEVIAKFPAPTDANYKPEMKAMCIRIDHLGEGGAVWVDDVCVKEAVAMDEWESWQSLGQDQHSIVADPMFANPDRDDYRLKPESPAFKLGFKPIPVEEIGPYASPLRASWPIVEAEGAREKPLTIEGQ